jgi:hypothetical protein
MVLISIHPFALRKIFLVIVASLCFSALCLADPVLMVHRYSSAPDRSVKATATATTAATIVQEPLAAPDATAEFGPLGSVEELGNPVDLQFTQPGQISPAPALPSSVFRKAMCELRSSHFQAAIAARSSLPLPGEN